VSKDQVIIRELVGIEEMLQSERFQVEAWGPGEKPDNADILMALQSEGALVAGAFQENQMIGFLLGFPTTTPGLQHSHRLAIKPGLRGLGLGARLKWFQRDWCLERGLTKVRWTYDPLRAINAGLNIGVLGAVADEYFINYYGEMPGMNAGLPSDRIMAVWHLDSQRVTALDQGIEETANTYTELERLQIPKDIDALLFQNPDAALAERLRVRDAMMGYFADGYRIVGFDRKQVSYLLGR
jgi:predicted GNAT superfamily acetyltransferase